MCTYSCTIIYVREVIKYEKEAIPYYILSNLVSKIAIIHELAKNFGHS